MHVPVLAAFYQRDPIEVRHAMSADFVPARDL